MDLELKNRVAVVLGATGGIGSAVVKALAKEGASVVAVGRNQSALDALAADTPGVGAVRWDLAQPHLIDEVVSGIESRFGPVDILFNNSGGPKPGPAQGASPDDWAAQFQLMVGSIIAMTDRVIGGMRDRKWGRVITTTSSGVIVPIPNLALSNSLRLSLLGWSKTLAREVARDGVTVNVVVPGRIDTSRVRALDESKAQRESRTATDVAAESIASIPAGRYGRPEEYADVVAFLASARASYLTGSVIRVDGGYIPSI